MDTKKTLPYPTRRPPKRRPVASLLPSYVQHKRYRLDPDQDEDASLVEASETRSKWLKDADIFLDQAVHLYLHYLIHNSKVNEFPHRKERAYLSLTESRKRYNQYLALIEAVNKIARLFIDEFGIITPASFRGKVIDKAEQDPKLEEYLAADSRGCVGCLFDLKEPPYGAKKPVVLAHVDLTADSDSD